MNPVDTLYVSTSTGPWSQVPVNLVFLVVGGILGWVPHIWQRRRELKKRNEKAARAWSSAADQIRICLDRMHEHLRQDRATGRPSASELYWIPEIALSFYQTCPDLAVAHKVRWIDEIIHQFNYNLRSDRHPTALAFAREYYERLRVAFHEIRSDLGAFVAQHRLRDIPVPAELPAWEIAASVSRGGTD
jgi:hypothetical protein